MSFSFKRFLKVVNEDQLITLASTCSSIQDLANKLKLTPQQVRYLYKKINIALAFNKQWKTSKFDFLNKYTLEEIQPLVNEPIQAVSEKLNLKPKKVKMLFSHFNLTIPAFAFNYSRSSKVPKEEIERLYSIEKKSLSELSVIFNVSRQQVSNWLYFYNIPLRSRGTQKGTNRIKKHPIWNLSPDEFILKTKNYVDLKAFLAGESMSNQVFYGYLEEHNIPNPYAIKKLEITKEQLIDLYLIQLLTIQQIADHLGCHYQTVCRLLKKYDMVGSKPKTWQVGKTWKWKT